MNICDVCKGPVGYASLDLHMSWTCYNEYDEVHQTMVEPHQEHSHGHDYIVTCGNCVDRLAGAWDRFLKDLEIK